MHGVMAIILYFISTLIFVDQRRAPPDVPPATHNLTFSSSMSDEDFFKWLRSKGISDKDCKTLSGKCNVATDYYY